MPRKVLRTDVTDTAAGTNTNLTELTFSLAAGETYHFRAVFAWTIVDATDGAQFIVDTPATPTFVAYRATSALAAATTTILNSVTDGGEVSGTTAASTAGNITVIEGIITANAAGDLLFQVDCEGAGDVTVKKGSNVKLEPLLA